MLLEKTEDFSVLIANKTFFNQLLKNRQEAYKKLVEMSRNNDHTTGNLLDYLYHQNHHKLIGTDLWIQTNAIIPQKVNFTGKLNNCNRII